MSEKRPHIFTDLSSFFLQLFQKNTPYQPSWYEVFYSFAYLTDIDADYRQAKDDMLELLTAKANIDRILGKEPEARNAQQEKETEQR